MTEPIDDKKSDEQESNQKEDGSPSEAQKTDDWIPKSVFNKTNNQLKDALKLIEEGNKAREEEKNAQLAADNKYEELYKASEAKLEPLQLEAEQATRFREALKAGNEARLARIPEDLQQLIPQFDDPIKMTLWLDTNPNLYAETVKPRAPNLDGGAGGVSSTDLPKVTAKEAELAKNFGMTVEQYAKNKVVDSETSDFETK